MIYQRRLAMFIDLTAIINGRRITFSISKGVYESKCAGMKPAAVFFEYGAYVCNVRR